ncbi:hypothetical protein BJ944DRAFT_231219 [Cunninghamella echinulata]|nr:hypothetical protein BJ944DRAFT_231219 [Cunninghamella echinulata]
MSEIKTKKEEQEIEINSHIIQKTEKNNNSTSPPSDTATSLSTTDIIEQRNTVTSNSTSQTFNSQVYQQHLQDAIMALDSHGMSQNLMAAAAAAIAAVSASSLHPTPPSIITPTPITTATTASSTTTTTTTTTIPTATAAAATNEITTINNTSTSTNNTNAPNTISMSTSPPVTTSSSTPPVVTSQPESQPSEPAPLSPNSQHQRDLEIAKRESIRTANRERKKKWRLHNEERNKDNDLRCRVNKRANKLFGIEDSENKRQWVEEEFTKRREKRQEKERRKDIVNNVLSVPQNQHSSSLQQPQQTPTDDLAQSFAAYPAVFDASKILEIPSELQRHLLEQLNLALTNSKLPTSSIDFGQQTDNITPDDTHQHNEPSHSLTQDNSISELETKVTEALLPTTSSSSTSEAMDIDHHEHSTTKAEYDVQRNQNQNDNINLKKEDDDDLKQSNIDNNKENNNENNMNMNNNTMSTNEDPSQPKQQEYPYPVDAVLTLMQSNA